MRTFFCNRAERRAMMVQLREHKGKEWAVEVKQKRLRVENVMERGSAVDRAGRAFVPLFTVLLANKITCSALLSRLVRRTRRHFLGMSSFIGSVCLATIIDSFYLIILHILIK